MIKNNKFFIKNLKKIFFLGSSKYFKQLIDINSQLKIVTHIITTDAQKKEVPKKLEHFVFNKVDDKFKSFIKKKTDLERSLFISLGARYIFKANTINQLFRKNLINFHSTRLPYDAGGADITWRILREDRIDNQLCHIIDEGLDTGPIIDSSNSIYPKSCIIPADFKKFRKKLFLEFYKKTISNLKKGGFFELKNNPSYIGRYNPRINTEIDGIIDWNLNPYDLISFINAFDEPYKGASTFLNTGNFGKIFIKSAQLHAGDSSNHPYMSGIVSRHDKDWLVVCTNSKHSLLIEKVIDKKGENIIKKIKVGDRFYSPSAELEKAKKTRITYTSSGMKEK